MTRRGRKLALLTAATIAAGAVVAAVWIRATGGPGALDVLGRASPLHVALLLGLTASFVGARFIRWQFLLRRADVAVPTRGSLLAYLASLPGTATPAYVGEAIRCVFLRRRYQAPLRRTLLCLVLERLLDVAVLALVGLAVAQSWGGRAAMAGGVAVAAALALAALRIAGRAGVPAGALRELSGARSVLASMALSLVIWVPVTVGLAVAARGLGYGLAPLEAMRTYTSATLFGALTLMPAGVGVSGSAQIVQLQDAGLLLGQAVATVTLFRGLTTGVCLLAGCVFLVLEWRLHRGAAARSAQEHFDQLATEYNAQFKPHVWELLLERRMNLLAACLPEPARAGVGLDLGCGLGLQERALTRRGFRILGIDPSLGLLRVGKANGVPTAAASALRLPFADSSVDFVYAVGVLHHLIEPGAQDAALREVERVLKPGGVFVVQETNTRNPLFRFYMGYVFPILSRIDEGTERWLEPFRWRDVPGLELEAVRYFTFLPDFIPQKLMPPFLALERRLEASRLSPYSVHYQATLRKPRESSPLPAPARGRP